MAGAFDQAVAARIGFEVVLRLDKRDTGFLRKDLSDLSAKLGMGVDAGAHGSAPGWKLRHCKLGLLGLVDAALELPGISTDFLPEANRRRIGKVGPPNLDDVVPFFRFLGEYAKKVM